MMRVGLYWLLVVIVLVVGRMPVWAQGDDALSIGMMETVHGEIAADTLEQTWIFDGERGEQLSLLVMPTSGDLDPVVSLLAPDGTELATNDDADFPSEMAAAVEGVELPENGTYQIQVTRFDGLRGDTSGEYALSVLPSYAGPQFYESFNAYTAWESESGDKVSADLAGERLWLTVLQNDSVAVAWPDQAIVLPRLGYVQVQVAPQNDTDYWEAGLVFRYGSPTNYDVFAVSSQSDWALLSRSGTTWTALQDWTALADGLSLETGGALGVIIEDGSFSFLVNGKIVGALSMSTSGGQQLLGFSAGSIDQQDTLPVVVFDDVLVTGPLPESTQTVQEPLAELETWNATDSSIVMAELVEQGVVPEGGRQVMLIPSGFTTVSRPGIQTQRLGQGRTQSDFVMSAIVSLDSAGQDNACGLMGRWVDDDQYSIVYADGLGGVGVAEWHGDEFDPSYYTDDAPFDTLESVYLLLVAQDDVLSVYVNGEPVAQRSNAAVDGIVGMAAMSYDSEFVECLFDDTWLWVWNEG